MPSLGAPEPELHAMPQSLPKHQGHALILSPLGRAFRALVESRHGLIRTTNLNLPEVRRTVVALFFLTVDFCLVDVLPAVCTAKNVLDFLALHKFALKVALVEDHLVRAGPTFETIYICEMLLV